MLAEEQNFAGLARLSRALIGRAEAMDSGWRTTLDPNSNEIPVYGEQEQSPYYGQPQASGTLREGGRVIPSASGALNIENPSGHCTRRRSGV